MASETAEMVAKDINEAVGTFANTDFSRADPRAPAILSVLGAVLLNPLRCDLISVKDDYYMESVVVLDVDETSVYVQFGGAIKHPNPTLRWARASLIFVDGDQPPTDKITLTTWGASDPVVDKGKTTIRKAGQAKILGELQAGTHEGLLNDVGGGMNAKAYERRLAQIARLGSSAVNLARTVPFGLPSGSLRRNYRKMIAPGVIFDSSKP